MSRPLKKEFFDDRSEQAKIKLAIVEAIPEGVYWHNLVAVLFELAHDYSSQWVSIRLRRRWHGVNKESE